MRFAARHSKESSVRCKPSRKAQHHNSMQDLFTRRREETISATPHDLSQSRSTKRQVMQVSRKPQDADKLIFRRCLRLHLKRLVS